MKAVVQRVIDASVTVNGGLKGRIGHGLLVYLGVALEDTVTDADWLAEKVVNLRIFDDPEGKMNISLLELVNHPEHGVNKAVNPCLEQVNNAVNHDSAVVNTDVNHGLSPVNASVNHLGNMVNNVPAGSTPVGVLAISQFTLLGDARKGRRPSWGKAAPPEKARELYGYFIKKIREKAPCECGEFQAHMEVTYTNDGPVTILLDSRE